MCLSLRSSDPGPLGAVRAEDQVGIFAHPAGCAREDGADPAAVFGLDPGSLAEAFRPNFGHADLVSGAGFDLVGVHALALPPQPAAVGVPVFPIGGDGFVQKIGDLALPTVGLPVGVLLRDGGVVQLSGQDQGLSGLVPHHGLCPDLVHLAGGEVVVDVLFGVRGVFLLAIYGPITAI